MRQHVVEKIVTLRLERVRIDDADAVFETRAPHRDELDEPNRIEEFELRW